MNPGLAIFKNAQRLQGGEYDVRGKEPPFTQGGKWWWEKANEQAKLDAQQAAEHETLTPEESAQEEIDWQKNIKELLTITPNLTPEERKQVTDLNPADWDDSTREKVGQASEQAGKAMQLQQGTSNVNQGLYFYRKMLKKPKL